MPSLADLKRSFYLNALGLSSGATEADLESTYYASPGSPGSVSSKFAAQTMNLRSVVTPSGTNDTAAVNAALATFSAAGGGKLVIPRGNWKFSGNTGLALSTSNPIHMEFEDGAVWDMTGLTSTYGLQIGGSVGSNAALGANVSDGANTITCALSVSPGDIIRIQSTDLFETWTSQPKGELAEVFSSSGGVITLRSPLWDSYTAATTTVTLINAPRVSIEGDVTFLRNSNQGLLFLQYAKNVSLGGLRGEGARERVFYLDHVFGGVCDNLVARDFWYSGTGTSYGLVVGSSQHITERSLDLRGGRHALSHGGTFPFRDITVQGGFFNNDPSAVIGSLDFHPNGEYVKVIGATVLNGISGLCGNLEIADSTVRTTSLISGISLSIGRNADYIKIKNTDIKTFGTGQAGVQFIARNGANANTLGLLEVDASIRASSVCVLIAPNSSSDTGMAITRLKLSGDYYTPSTSSPVQITKSGAAAIPITRGIFKADRWRSDGGHGFTGLGAYSGRATFKGHYSTGKNLGSAIYCDMFTDVVVENFELESTNNPYCSQFLNTGLLSIRNGLVDGGTSNGGIQGNLASEVSFQNVKRVNTTGTPLLSARNFSRLNSAGKVTTNGTAAPTTGTWAVGDRCENNAPAVGSPKAWACTAAGTPGTWVSEGNL